MLIYRLNYTLQGCNCMLLRLAYQSGKLRISKQLIVLIIAFETKNLGNSNFLESIFGIFRSKYDVIVIGAKRQLHYSTRHYSPEVQC